MNTGIGPLGKEDHFRKQKYMHDAQMQLISSLFRGWADTGCSSPVSLRSPRFELTGLKERVETVADPRQRRRLELSLT